MNKSLLLESAARELTPKLVRLSETQPTPIVLIDGRAGSGKSTFAETLQSLLFKELEQLPRLVHMDDLYPGWQGLAAGSLYLVDRILRPLRANTRASWQNWDWGAERRGGADIGNGWRELEPGSFLIVEGCGSVSRSSSRLADLAIWVDADKAIRKERFLARDQSRFAEQWAHWSIQEDEFYQTEDSESLCQVRISNS